MPAVPGNPRLSHNGSSGKLTFRFNGDGSGNTRNFSVQHAESDTGPWIDHDLSTSTKVDIEGLTPGKVYYARAKANAAAGSSDWTVPTSKMAI